MTNQQLNITVAQALALPLDTLQTMSIEGLEAIAEVLATSKDKRATRKLDLVKGLLKGKKAEAPKAEPVTVENSTKKPAPKKKAPAKKPTAKKAESVAEPETVEEEKPKTAKKPAPKKQEAEAPKAPKSLKRPTSKKKDLSKMSPEELKAYVAELEEKAEGMPKEIKGENVHLKRVEFDTIEDIQKHLLAKPFQLFLLADEKQDENLTQFQVLFANAEILVLLDRNRQKNSTVNVDVSKMTAEHLVFDKLKFSYAFYTKA